MRFPEFTEEWVNVSLKDVADFQKERISSGLLDESTYISTENILQNFQGVQSAISIPANTNVVAYKKNDILLSNIRPYLKKVWFSDRIGGCSADVFVLRSKTCEPEFLYNVIASDKFINYVMSGAKGVKMPRGDKNQMESFSFSIPAVVEQRKISRLFQLLDERIVTQNKIIEDLKKLKSAIRKKMFSFLKDEYTESFEINQLLDYEQPTAYIVANDEYSTDTSLTPVLTANKGFILGYTDEKFGIYQKGECIIFDDFTMDAKYVSFPFKVKSSAIKILTAKPNVNLRFMFEYLSYWELKSEEHKRHYISEIASLVIELPSKERQSIIASLMTSLNSKLDIEAKTKIRYEEQKRYLLSQMFI
ncbi:restriction endonuclease subunit S [Bacteroides stercoris]|uniref:Restriction endonuclease subunit S n=1 Tax=Bacteroides stercoris TaxID=46506 RepID=A0A3E4UK71_BACSE|nr:restriction endonuclease subunit S [Bacteroides stercoris]RGM09757.1 restriction endonuclease subunit S [Bacteroides stercoris]